MDKRNMLQRTTRSKTSTHRRQPKGARQPRALYASSTELSSTIATDHKYVLSRYGSEVIDIELIRVSDMAVLVLI